EPFQGVVEFDDRVIGFELGGRVDEGAVERGQEGQAGAALARLDGGLEGPDRDPRAAEPLAAHAQPKPPRKGARSARRRASEGEIAGVGAQEQTLAKNVSRQEQLERAGAAPAVTLDDLTAELRATSERRIAQEQRFKALRSGARSEEIAAADAQAQAAAAAL